MGRNRRIVLIVLLSMCGISVAAFLTLVGYYTIKIRGGETVPELSDRFTRSSSTINTSVPLSPELVATISNATGDAVFGSTDASIQIVEFADVECPYSAEFSQTLRKAMIKYPTKFHFVYRDFPLNEIHSRATAGALALTCASEQGRFWQLHDKLFSNQNKLAANDMLTYAAQVGLRMDRFRECLINPATKKELTDDVAAGTAAGVVGTPTFFINGRKIEGAIPADLFEKLLTQSK